MDANQALAIIGELKIIRSQQQAQTLALQKIAEVLGKLHETAQLK